MSDGVFTSQIRPVRDSFSTTRWSVVLVAGSIDGKSMEALETLCRTYWPPIYGYMRRSGKGAEVARDLTQEFFAKLISAASIAKADPQRGRFRSYLLSALKHFLADRHDYDQAAKRGGNVQIVPMSVSEGEDSYFWEPQDERTPERIFERRWALAVMAHALERLEEECRLSGKARLFARLRDFLCETGFGAGYPQVAKELGITEASARMSVTRLRRRYGELVRAEVEQTLGTHDDLEDELRYLLKLLRES